MYTSRGLSKKILGIWNIFKPHEMPFQRDSDNAAAPPVSSFQPGAAVFPGPMLTSEADCFLSGVRMGKKLQTSGYRI